MKKVFTLAEVFSPHCAGFRKKAFTLAEVLITLGIIGVVAALTLPTLIANYKKQTYVNQLKKVVNTIENAAQLAVADDGVSSFKDTKLLSALHDIYMCKVYGLNCDSGYSTVLKKYFKIIDIKGRTTSVYHELNGDRYNTQGQTLVLSDGSELYIGVASALGPYIGIDINGEHNGPNIFGYDYFVTVLVEDTGFVKDTYWLECQDIEEYIQKKCYLSKIVSDGWKINY